MKDKTFATLAGLFFLIFFGGVIAVTLEKPTLNFLTRASTVNPSPLKSFAVVFPQVGVAANAQSGKEPTKIKVSVYIRDVNGTVLPNRTVKLATLSASVNITPSDTQSTNTIGQAQFFITANAPGTVNLTVTDVASNTTVVNVPSVEFTK